MPRKRIDIQAELDTWMDNYDKGLKRYEAETDPFELEMWPTTLRTWHNIIAGLEEELKNATD